MQDLLIPNHIAHERVNAAMAGQADAHMAEARHWTHELKRIDPTLSVAWVDVRATEFDHPGRWHVRKEIPGNYDEWWPLLRGAVGGTPPDGYIAPGAWILEQFQASDMWNPRVHRNKREAKDKLREAKRRARALEAEQRQDHMAEAHRAAKRLRGDAGFKTRTDKKRQGAGIVLPPGAER